MLIAQSILNAGKRIFSMLLVGTHLPIWIKIIEDFSLAAMDRSTATLAAFSVISDLLVWESPHIMSSHSGKNNTFCIQISIKFTDKCQNKVKRHFGPW